MRTPRFYCPETLAVGKIVNLGRETAHHAINVLRMGVDNPVALFNGHGGEYHGRITSVSKKCVEIKLYNFDSNDRESPLFTELAIGLSKGDRMDWVLQKATELGVASIVPIFSERTEVKLKQDRLQKKMNHWKQIYINACEQSERTRLPKLSNPSLFNDYLDHCQMENKLIFHNANQSGSLQEKKFSGGVSLLIGPEGGFSESEVSRALAAGFAVQSLGPRTLRTETAPVVALALLQYLWGDLNSNSGEIAE